MNKFIRDEAGATMIEYALIGAVVALGVLVALGNLRNEIGQTFSRIAGTLDSAQSLAQSVPAVTE